MKNVWYVFPVFIITSCSSMGERALSNLGFASPPVAMFAAQVSVASQTCKNYVDQNQSDKYTNKVYATLFFNDQISYNSGFKTVYEESLKKYQDAINKVKNKKTFCDGYSTDVARYMDIGYGPIAQFRERYSPLGDDAKSRQQIGNYLNPLMWGVTSVTGLADRTPLDCESYRPFMLVSQSSDNKVWTEYHSIYQCHVST